MLNLCLFNTDVIYELSSSCAKMFTSPVIYLDVFMTDSRPELNLEQYNPITQ